MNLENIMHEVDSWVTKAAAYQKTMMESTKLHINTKKYATDFVTNVDIRSEEILIDCIRGAYPEHSILTEEQGDLKSNSDYQWIIDPIDGTTNFIHKFPMSSISIALKYKEETLLGMVYSPWLDMKFQAIRQGGAYFNGKQISVSDISQLEQSLLSTGFPSGGHNEYINLAYFNQMIKKVAGIRRTGSAALDLCFVAASYFDGFWEFNLNDWDMCAGALIVEEAGGIVQKIEVKGQQLLICANQLLYDELKDNLMNQH